MEKTLARAIFKKMVVGKAYTTSELFALVGEDYYKIVPTELHPYQPNGKPVNSIVSEEMWKIVKSGFATTYKAEETLAIVRGLKFGTKPTCFKTYTVRYWKRTK